MTSIACFAPPLFPATLRAAAPLLPPPRFPAVLGEHRRSLPPVPGPELYGSKWSADQPRAHDHEHHSAKVGRLKVLAGKPRAARHEQLRAMPRISREELLFGSYAMVDRIGEELDWASLDLHGTSYHPLRALALAIISAQTYRVFADASARRVDGRAPYGGLLEAGFEVTRLGCSGYSARALLAARGREVVVAFSGTRTFQDLLRDLDAFQLDGFGGRVHAGMKKSIDEIWPELEAALAEIRGDGGDGGPVSVVFTGHSLGGALALLAATRLHALEGYEVTGVHAFGPPKALDAQARAAVIASGLADRVFRVLMHSDIVHDLPWPQLFGPYEHVGTPVYVDQDGCCRMDATEAEIAAERRGTFNWLELMTRGRWIKPIRDHEAPSYVHALYLHHRDETPDEVR